MKFELVSKKWAKAIQIFETKGEDEFHEFCEKNRLDITDPERCVVGEAYHWKDQYSNWDEKKWCKTCDNIAVDFSLDGFTGYHFGSPIEKKTPILPIFKKIKKRFEIHWCRVHSKKP